MANLLAKPPHGKPLIGLQGKEPPSRRPESIDMFDFPNFDFIVEGDAIVLKERYRERRIIDLSAKRIEVLSAIEKLSTKDV
jgi:hypothetical protein